MWAASVARIEEAIVVLAVARTGVEPAAAAPASTRNGLAAIFDHEVRPVGEQRRVDVGDVDRRTRRLALVVEPWEELEHGRPHHLGDRVDVSLSSNTDVRRHRPILVPRHHGVHHGELGALNRGCDDDHESCATFYIYLDGSFGLSEHR